jgi:type I restriction enzyme R subunit
VLYLADRNILVDQPKDKYFAPVFKDAVYKLGGGEARRGRSIYFALYQSMERGDEVALFKAFPPNHFDLIIVDECHRGSATEASRWRRILDYYASATQIGMTATPINDRERDTFGYFGNPVYTYSLAQGIEDGFLAPYRVRKVRLNVDMTGWRPEPSQHDLYGNEIPDNLYTPKEYERVLAILERTHEAANCITGFLYRNGRMGKTIVFCENNDHAHRMRVALNNANDDMVQRYENYVFRITDADGAAGRALLDEFMKVDTDEPVIAVTSRLLTTGIDIPTVRNIVLFRRIASMPEFKQIVGRGTRVFEEAGKFAFDIIDFVDATRLFNDPAFDGPPMRVTRENTDSSGHITDPATYDETEGEQAREPESEYQRQDDGLLPAQDDGALVGGENAEEIRARARRLYVNGVDVFVWGQAFYVAEGDGQRLRMVEYSQYVRDRVLSLNLSASDLRTQWARARSRRELTEVLAREGIDVGELAEHLGEPAADELDLLLYLAWQMPVVSRAERARRVRRTHQQFLKSFAPEARRILELILDKYEVHGVSEVSPHALRVPPFTAMGQPAELAANFGGPTGLRDALDRLGQRLYDVA